MKHTSLKFEDVLRPQYYSKGGDDEPFKCLERIFPFSKVTTENMYEYEEILYCLTSSGWGVICPLIIQFFLEQSDRYEENISSSFEHMFILDDVTNRIVTPWLQSLSEAEKGLILAQLGTLILKFQTWRSPEEDILAINKIRSIIAQTSPEPSS